MADLAVFPLSRIKWLFWDESITVLTLQSLHTVYSACFRSVATSGVVVASCEILQALNNSLSFFSFSQPYLFPPPLHPALSAPFAAEFSLSPLTQEIHLMSAFSTGARADPLIPDSFLWLFARANCVKSHFMVHKGFWPLDCSSCWITKQPLFKTGEKMFWTAECSEVLRLFILHRTVL